MREPTESRDEVPSTHNSTSDPTERAADPFLPDGKALFSGRVAEAPELVIAIVSALGTSVRAVEDDFRSALASVGYGMEKVRVSDLIHELHREVHGDTPPKTSIAEQLMSQGDDLRDVVRHGGAAVALAILSIRRQREEATGDASVERTRVATFIRSVKHPEELRLLRTVYGSRLLVVGVSASPEQRDHDLVARLRRDHPGETADWYAGEASALLLRDQKDQTRPLGQRVRDAFSQADAFVWVRPGIPTTPAIRRIVDLWFGKPFETPKPDEQGMYQAFAAQFRSAASGRQVGAAIADDLGEILVTGTNEVPRPGGGQYWPGDEPDYRDFVVGAETNDLQKYLIIQDVLRRLADAGWLSEHQSDRGVEQIAAEALAPSGPLRDSRVNDLIEFGRIAHAEMAAICTAARRGTPIGGSTLFTTTYPCHECARLIIGAGIRRLVYIDPYPKSQVPEMYRGQVSEGGSVAPEGGVVPFVPFEGISPRLYSAVFAMGARGRDAMGNFDEWVPRPRLTVDPGAISSMIAFERTVSEELLDRLMQAGWTPRENQV